MMMVDDREFVSIEPTSKSTLTDVNKFRYFPRPVKPIDVLVVRVMANANNVYDNFLLRYLK